MRATLYDGLSALRRARLHGRVGEALIARRGAQLDPHLGELAHHFALAAPVDRPERAVDFALAAGRRADRLLAWEEAAGHYRGRAARARAGGRGRRPPALRAAARARRVAGARGRATAMRATFAAAAATARALGDPGAARARGARLRGPLVAARARRGGRRRRCCRRRSARSATRTRRCARGCSPGSRSSCTTRAIRRGGWRCRRRRSRSPGGSATRSRSRSASTRATTRCGGRRPWTSGSRSPPSCAGSPRRSGDPELELEGAGWTVVDLLELGDIAGADIQIAAASRLAEALHRPLYQWWTSLFRCARAQIDGRFEEAERLALETLAIGRRGQAENAIHAFAQAMFNIRREQGRLGEVEEAVRGFIALYPAVPGVALRARAAARRAGAARTPRAREFEALAAAGFDALPRDAQVADRDDAAGRGLRAARRRGARGASCTSRCCRTRAATSSSAARRPATGRPRGSSGCSRRRMGERGAARPSAHSRMGRGLAPMQSRRWARGAVTVARTQVGVGGDASWRAGRRWRASGPRAASSASSRRRASVANAARRRLGDASRSTRGALARARCVRSVEP